MLSGVVLSSTGTILGWPKFVTDSSRYAEARSAIVRDLSKLPHKQLAIVQYPPNHNFHVEWLYNEADIDASHVVWAPDMGAELNSELIWYYRDRTVRFP